MLKLIKEIAITEEQARALNCLTSTKENTSYVLKAKLIHSDLYSNSKKVNCLHISPAILQHHESYTTETCNAGANCCRLYLTKAYTLSQQSKIKTEIDLLKLPKIENYQKMAETETDPDKLIQLLTYIQFLKLL